MSNTKLPHRNLKMQEANIGKSLQEAQYRARMPVERLAEILGETRQSVYYTRKQKSIAVHKVQKLAEIFGMSVDAFIQLGVENEG